VNGAVPVKLNFKLVESPIRKESSPEAIIAVVSLTFIGCDGVGEISVFLHEKSDNPIRQIRDFIFIETD
jgi:hypothetical protein